MPGYASHYVGVGGAVFNDRGEILVIVEKYLIDGVKRWKLPGGLVERGERLSEAVEREVRCAGRARMCACVGVWVCGCVGVKACACAGAFVVLGCG
jgi:hypothetical protein